MEVAKAQNWAGHRKKKSLRIVKYTNVKSILTNTTELLYHGVTVLHDPNQVPLSLIPLVLSPHTDDDIPTRSLAWSVLNLARFIHVRFAQLARLFCRFLVWRILLT
jgi:hypothetical protein